MKTLSAGQHRERLVPDKLLLNLIHNAMQHAEPDAGAIDVSLPADRPPGQAG
ncbi:hypothetical protein [Paenibacillus sp. GCM10023250]|uniref:hypothetical protein n=1 Tax=Paenibacillus sp. GCM10023250 TaxID=3252648 RepID=UPI0036138E7E